MNEAPFGLPREVFSILMVVGWLVLGPLVAGWFMRKRRIARIASFDQTAAQAPPVYPSTSSPTQPYADLVGQWRFTSITRWLGIVPAVFLGLVAIQLSLVLAMPVCTP